MRGKPVGMEMPREDQQSSVEDLERSGLLRFI
jgi:hypothetical protein